MKTINSFSDLKHNKSPLILVRKYIKPISWFFLIVMLHLNVSCKYFKVKEVPVANTDEILQKIQELNSAMRYVVVHSGENYYHLDELRLNSDTNSFGGTVQELTSDHNYKKQPLLNKTYKYDDDEQSPLNELHIYLKPTTNLVVNSTIDIPVDQVQSIALVDKNTGRTVANIVVGVVGGIILVNLLILALKSSCPFIYSFDGQDYVFNGELYPGNIIKNAQTPDYIKLSKLANADGFYKIKISNELLEVEHTDQILLWAVDHPKTSKVLLDQKGNPVYFNSFILPYSVIEDGQQSNPDLLSEIDNNYFAFNSNQSNLNSTRELTLKFKRPINSNTANFKLSAKNSLWLDMLFGKMNEKFGSYYPTFQKNQLELTREKADQWKEDQSIALSVSIKENGEWKKLSDIPSAGPLAFREYGLSINLDNVKGDTVELKLETGFMFWEIDYAAMSFDADNKSKIHKIPPFKAITNDGVDVATLLLEADQQYHIQDNIGQSVEVSFEVPVLEENMERTFFIQSQGYYTYIRDYSGIPNFTELLQFRKPGYFPRFSEMLYNEKVVPYINAELQTTLAK